MIMTKEDIKKELQSQLDKPDNKEDRIFNKGFSLGFIEAATWRINSVWHNDLKKGKNKKPILVRFKNGLFNLFEDIRELKGIENKVEIFAYLEDLIPETED